MKRIYLYVLFFLVFATNASAGIFSGGGGGTCDPQEILTSTISDLDTTHAPDGNSVFGALLLKAPSVGSTSIVSYGPTVIQSVMCSDSGDANPGALTITPTAGLGVVNVEVTVLDAHGCRVMMATTDSVQNQLVVLRNVSAANTATFYSPVSYNGVSTALTFVDGGAGADTLTDSASRFITDGFVVGMTITIAGATTSGNDGSRVVTAVTAATLTFATGSWAGGEAGAVGMTVNGTAYTQLHENSPRVLFAQDAMVLQYDGSEYVEILHTTTPSFLSGNVANLPGTCTKDQWYLATDTGTKGTLYKCGGNLAFTSIVDMDATATVPWEKDISIPNPSSTGMVRFRTTKAVTLSAIGGIVDPANSGESVVVDIQECDGDGDSCVTIITGTFTCGNTNTTATIGDTAIAANVWILIDLGTVTGTVSNLSIYLAGTEALD